MPYDALLMFSNAQAITATAVSTDVLDLGLPSVNPRSPTGARFPAVQGQADGHLNPIVIKVGQSFNTLTSLTIELQGSNDNSTFATVATTGAIPLASLTAGAEFGFLGFPIRATYRYWRLNYVVAGTAPTNGNITAGFADGFQTAGYI